MDGGTPFAIDDGSAVPVADRKSSLSFGVVLRTPYGVVLSFIVIHQPLWRSLPIDWLVHGPGGADPLRWTNIEPTTGSRATSSSALATQVSLAEPDKLGRHGAMQTGRVNMAGTR